MTSVKRLTAAILVLVVAMSVFVLPAAAAGLTCLNCDSDNIYFVERTITYCGEGDYGPMYYIEDTYKCRDCGKYSGYGV